MFSKYTSGSQSQAVIAGISESAGNMALTFNTESGNTVGERLRITSAGNVGINETNLIGDLSITGANGSTMEFQPDIVSGTNELQTSIDQHPHIKLLDLMRHNMSF